jgi:hypothetical protein
MTLRELMTQRILSVIDEETLLEDFGYKTDDLELIYVECFLDLYDSIFTFQG